MKKYYFYILGYWGKAYSPRHKGAFYCSWNEAMFDSKTTDQEVVTEDQIIKLSAVLSKTKRERLLKLKEGSDLELARTSASHTLYVHRMTQEEIDIYDRICYLEDQRKDINKKIYKATKDLQEQLKQVERELRKLRK